MKFSLLYWLALLMLLLAACKTPNMQLSITPTAHPTASATATPKVLQQNTAAGQLKVDTPIPAPSTVKPATFTSTPTTAAPTASSIPPSVTPYPTWTPIPSFTPAPEVRTPAPPAECPEGGTPRSLTLGDLYTPNMDESIRAYLNARGSAVGLEANLNTLTNTADPSDDVSAHVHSVDVTGDGVPDAVMDLTIPEVVSYGTTAAMVFTCRERKYVTALYLLLSPQEGIYPQGGYQILSLEDMNQDGIREVVVVLKVFDNRRYYILTWDGSTFTSLLEPRFDDILLQTVYYIEAYSGEGIVIDTDGDDNLELLITYNEEPSRQEIWAWNGHAFVLQSE